MELLKIEEARKGDLLVGLRLTAQNGETLLVFSDQKEMPGFRIGSNFSSGICDPVEYKTVTLSKAEIKGGASAPSSLSAMFGSGD